MCLLIKLLVWLGLQKRGMRLIAVAAKLCMRGAKAKKFKVWL
jgi:hypothetical protein